MKKLIVGLGLTILAMPAAQVWAGSYKHMTADDIRTLQANQSRPVVRLKSHRVETISPANQSKGLPCACDLSTQPYVEPPAYSFEPDASADDIAPMPFIGEPLTMSVAYPEQSSSWQRSGKLHPQPKASKTASGPRLMHAFLGPQPNLKQIVGNAQSMPPALYWV